MQTKVFAIFDSAAKAFLPPFCLPRNEQAQRAFSDCVNSPNHQFNEHPEDYTLFHIGFFDDSTGVFTNAEPANVQLGGGLVYKRVPAPHADLFTNGKDTSEHVSA